MRWWWLFLFIFILISGAGVGYWFFIYNRSGDPAVSPIAKILEKPLEKYTIENLGFRQPQAGPIVLDEPIATASAYTVYNFHFISSGKKVTGLAHLPAGRQVSSEEKFPVIVQLRGYVDREIYTTGEGTKRSGQVYAQNGFISLAPDFLGYGGSDMPSENSFEERFQTYTVTLDLLASVETLSQADAERVGIWGHSNGGQIALTVLESTQKPYPTVLWAPVTKPFPYSILYYTDEFSDRGKALRRVLAKFEEDYDVELYSLPSYVDRISAPMMIHQGGADDAVPEVWSDEFVKLLKEREKSVTYHVYSGADHNMVPSWGTVVSRDIEFFRSKFK